MTLYYSPKDGGKITIELPDELLAGKFKQSATAEIMESFMGCLKTALVLPDSAALLLLASLKADLSRQEIAQITQLTAIQEVRRAIHNVT